MIVVVGNRFQRGKADYLYSELERLLGEGSNLRASLVFWSSTIDTYQVCDFGIDEIFGLANDTKHASSMVVWTKQKDPGQPSFDEREDTGQLEEPKVRVLNMLIDAKVN